MRPVQAGNNANGHTSFHVTQKKKIDILLKGLKYLIISEFLKEFYNRTVSLSCFVDAREKKHPSHFFLRLLVNS